MKDKELLALVKKASKQDRDAFNELCNIKAREIIYLCTCEMQNHHDGEDAAQEVFIRMQRGISALKAPEAFNVWLNRLVHSTCLNMKRDSMKRKNTIPIDAFDDSFLQDDSQFALPQEFMEDAEKRGLVAEVIEGLPEKYRTCVLLHYYQSLSYAQIAEVLDISVDAVNNNMRMARKHMKRELEERLDKPSAAWAALPVVASGPILTASLQEAAVVAISPTAIANCLAAAGVGAGTTAGAAGSAFGGLGAKVIAPIAIAAAVVAGVLGYIAYNTPAEIETPPAISQPQPASSTPAPASSEPAPVAELPALVAGSVSLLGGGPLPDVTMELLNAADGTVVQTAATDAAGAFRFEEVPYGQYRLQATLPDYGQGSHTLAVQVGGEDSFLIDADSRESFAGLPVEIDLTAEINGYLALCLNNEQLSYSDQNLPGVRVLLLDSAGNQIAETTVTSGGQYYFGNLLVSQRGIYTIRVVVDGAVPGADVQVQDAQLELYPGYRG